MYHYTRVVFCFAGLFALFAQMTCSSIPMWEYLTKDEKTAYLYSMFKNQVEEYCEFSEMENCVDGLTRFGLKRLREMPENRLDEMDPYQRGASSIIWNAMMQGHETVSKTRTSATTVAPPRSEAGEEAAASARIDSVVRVPPPKGFTANVVEQEAERIESGTPLYRKPSKYFRAPLPVARRPPQGAEGPLVVRVHPDGTPVRDDEQNVVPQDEDLRQYLLAKVKLPDY